MDWPEHLNLILAILAQVPWGWVTASIIAGIILGMLIIIIVSLMVISGDAQHRDSYYEDHIGGNHRG